MFKVLVADDEVNIRNLIKLKLSGEGYDVVCASDGNEALSRLYSKCFDICIVDVMMPVMDGLQLCKQIKQNLRTCHIPVIILSAKTDLKEQLEVLQVGAEQVLDLGSDHYH